MPTRHLALSLALLAGCREPAELRSADLVPIAALTSATTQGVPTTPGARRTAPPARRDAQAVAHGRQVIAAAREMHALYPATCGTLSYSGGNVATASWFGSVGLHGRYTLQLVAPVTLDASLTHVVVQGEPSFLLEEIDRYGSTSRPDGSPAALVVVRRVRFGAAQWAAVVRAGGDLSPVLGHPMRTNAPVPSFDAALPRDSSCEALATTGRGDLPRADPIHRELDRRRSLALAHGREAIAPAREMRALYRGVIEFLDDSTGAVGGTVWTSTVPLHGRYELTLHVPVTLDASRTRVVAQGAPRFHVVEVERVEPRGQGSGGLAPRASVDSPSSDDAWVIDDPMVPPTLHHADSARFGAVEWAAIVRADGALSSVLARPMRTDAPVPGFAEEWARAHAP